MDPAVFWPSLAAVLITLIICLTVLAYDGKLTRRP
jgi:hypothetical protein